jgi:hypothetical protein
VAAVVAGVLEVPQVGRASKSDRMDFAEIPSINGVEMAK